MAKSIIDIEVKAEAFEKFAALFKKYDDQLSKMPGKWDRVAVAVDAAGNKYDSFGMKIESAAEAVQEIAEAQEKVAKSQEKINKQVASADRSFGSIRRNIGASLKDMASTTAHLAKWVGLSAGLGAIGMGGSLFGIASLAGGAGDTRRQAQGLGVSAGEMKAANTNFARYVDSMATMSNIAEAQTDPNRKWAFGAAGVDIQRNAADILPQLMREARRIYQQDPANASARLQARGFTELGISVADARRLASIKEEELETAIKRYSQDKKDLEMNDSLLRKWQDLDVQLDRSKQNIVAAFIDGLVPLVPDIEEFSKKVAEAIKIFLANPELKVWMRDFVDNVKELATALPDMVDGVKTVVSFIPGTKSNEARKQETAESFGLGKTRGELKKVWSSAVDFFTGKGWSGAQAAGIVGNLQQESGMNPGAANPKSGMRGLAQWDSNRRRDFAAWSGKPIETASMQEQLEFINYELTQGKERKAGAALAKAATVEQAATTFEQTYERSGGSAVGSRVSYANAAYAAHINSLQRNRVGVSLYNNTGGSATAVIGAAATPDLGYSAFAGY